MENTVVRVFFLEVRARSPNTVAAAPAPTPIQNHTLSSSNTRCEIMALVGYAISLIRAGQTAEAGFAPLVCTLLSYLPQNKGDWTAQNLMRKPLNQVSIYSSF